GLHLLTGGNGYALIIWSQAGDPIQLLPLDCAVKPMKKASGGLSYSFTLDGKTFQDVDQAYMLHIPGLAWNGVCGMSPIRYAAQSIG
ncbi:phage portal protein, partial [Limosilactobacillus reuteri]|uniref:phage portal protein n=1 Tax=Limosilactobacillus reuteri TaxID=1598 RepID=UPI00207CB458